MAILVIVLAALIPYAWSIIGTGTKSNTQEEVFSQARYISERIKYEIRNSTGINSVTSTSISLSTNVPATNPTLIDLNSGNIRLKQGAGAYINLNSSDVIISSLTFTNYSSLDLKSKNIGFTFTLDANYASSRQEFIETTTIKGAAEIRN